MEWWHSFYPHWNSVSILFPALLYTYRILIPNKLIPHNTKDPGRVMYDSIRLQWFCDIRHTHIIDSLQWYIHHLAMVVTCESKVMHDVDALARTSPAWTLMYHCSTNAWCMTADVLSIAVACASSRTDTSLFYYCLLRSLSDVWTIMY